MYWQKSPIKSFLMKFVFYKRNIFLVGLELPQLSQSEKVTLEVEKVYEVCNEVTPDILLGLCCIGL